MPTIGGTGLTLLDHAKRLDPDGKIALIAELQNQINEVLLDMQWLEGNLPTGHRTTVRTGLPQATWRKLNYGVQPTKSTTKQVDDTCGMLETYSEVDKDLADLNGNTAEFRLSEDRPHIEGMNQQFSTTLFYGDTGVNPERFLGFGPRYQSGIATPTGPTGSRVFDAGGRSANAVTSCWLVVWGPNTVHGIFPKASVAGLSQKDLGEQTLYDASGNMGRYQGYRTHYQWKAGLVVRDWRYVMRIANIATSGTSNLLTPELLVQAYNQIININLGTPVIYCNRSVKTQIDIAAMDKTNAHYQVGEIFGRHVTTFWGIPIRLCDSIVNTEAVIAS